MARGGTRIRATRRPVVVIAGEDANDRKCLRVLLEQFCPEMRGRIVEVNDPVRLRCAGDDTLSKRAETLARKVRARAARENADVACVFVHEDLDGVDGPNFTAERERVQRALVQVLGKAHYVLAVEEIEAWLLLFPEALTGLVSSWKVPAQYRSRDTGTVVDPKGVMKRIVSGNAGRRYRESDAPEVLNKAAALGCLNRPAGTNRSWTQLRFDAGECCQRHIPQQRRLR